MKQNEMAKVMIRGQAAELNVSPQFERHLANLKAMYRGAKAVGEVEQVGLMLALAYITLEIQE